MIKTSTIALDRFLGSKLSISALGDNAREMFHHSFHQSSDDLVCDSKKKQRMIEWWFTSTMLESQHDVAYWKYALVNDGDMFLVGYQNHPENNLSNSSCQINSHSDSFALQFMMENNNPLPISSPHVATVWSWICVKSKSLEALPAISTCLKSSHYSASILNTAPS